MNRNIIRLACLLLVAHQQAPEPRPDETKASYLYRHPEETPGLFGIEPGMTLQFREPG